MLFDRYGLELSTDSTAARDAYVTALDCMLAAGADIEKKFHSVIALDPGFALAHAGYARNLAIFGRGAEARAAGILPDAWGEAVTRWRVRAQPYRNAQGWADATTEYLFWQTLVGAWPIDVERMDTYVLKAAREAKLHTGWTEPNSEYEDALRALH